MRNISLVLSSIVIFSSCSSDNRPITLVCNGIQTIDSKNLVTNKFYSTEKNKISRTYKFIYEEKLVEIYDKIERKKVWVFSTDSQPEIFNYDKKLVTTVNNSQRTITDFGVVFVRKDDISVTKDYSSKDDKETVLYSNYVLNIDRISGSFLESFIYSTNKSLTKESLEGTCFKVEKNKI